MRSPCVGVFFFRPYLRVDWMLLGGYGLLAMLLFTPAAWSRASAQNSTRNADQGATVPPSDPQKPETVQAANDRIVQLAIVQGAKKDYILDSGDLVGIEVFDVPELTRDVRVSDSGYVSLPLLPVKVHAAGLTAFQLQDKLAELLLANGLVSNPHVTVTIKEQHGEPITVIGAVRTPMVIQAVRQMSLLEVLSRAGGIADDAGGQILITRGVHSFVAASPAPDEPSEADAPKATEPASESASQPAAGSASAQDSEPTADPALLADPLTVRVSLNELLDTGDSKYNITLNGGDVVSVPRAGVVYAVGGVQRAGGFVMASDRQQLTVLKVLSLSGGLAPSAKKHDAVIIRQSPDSQQQQVPVDLDKILAHKAKDPVMQASDILFVPVSGGKQAMGRVAGAAMSLATGVAIVRLGN